MEKRKKKIDRRVRKQRGKYKVTEKKWERKNRRNKIKEEEECNVTEKRQGKIKKDQQ